MYVFYGGVMFLLKNRPWIFGMLVRLRIFFGCIWVYELELRYDNSQIIEEILHRYYLSLIKIRQITMVSVIRIYCVIITGFLVNL